MPILQKLWGSTVGVASNCQMWTNIIYPDKRGFTTVIAVVLHACFIFTVDTVSASKSGRYYTKLIVMYLICASIVIFREQTPMITQN